MKLTVGTRGSELALVQARLVCKALQALPQPVQTVVSEIATCGDLRQGTAAAKIPDKKKWVLEIEQALVRGEIDCAVHSAKDLPNELEPGTLVWPVLHRESPEDVFIGARRSGSERRLSFSELPDNALIGTASIRRAAQLMRLRPGVRIVPHRGNVPTRIRKLDESSELHGIVLAHAGLSRLGLDAAVSDVFAPAQLLPAMNQGIIAVQFREDDAAAAAALEQLVEIPTLAEWQAERAAVELLEADCYSAVALKASSDGRRVELFGRVLSPDGAEAAEADGEAAVADAADLGRSVAEKLISRGARELIACCSAQS